MPGRMTRASARFFAADWEGQSFLEFFVDLQLRVAEDASGGAGRTVARLADHARFALQLTLVRSVDSFVAYLAEIARDVTAVRTTSPWQSVLASHDGPTQKGPLRSNGPLDASVPVDVSVMYVTTLAHGNVRLLGRQFEQATDIRLFTTADDVERLSRLSSLRNLIVHGRTFASDELVALIDESASVGGLGLRLASVREDLWFLYMAVVRIDESVASRWDIERPITSEQLFEAISAASNASSSRQGPSAVAARPEIDVPLAPEAQ